QKILHRRFLVKLVEIGLAPIVACLLEIGKMRERNRSAREQRGYVCVWRAPRIVHGVNNSARRHRRDDDKQPETFHEPASFNPQPSTFNLDYALGWNCRCTAFNRCWSTCV